MKNLPGWVKGGCLGAALVVGSVVLFAMCSSVVTSLSGQKGFSESHTRASVAHALSNSRTLQTTLDRYKKDKGFYPLSDSQYSEITTPVAYLSAPIADPFAPASGDGPRPPLLFYTTANDFLIWSVGPDGKSDLDPGLDLKSGPEAILAKTYDATNGTVSPGDIIRTNLDLHR